MKINQSVILVIKGKTSNFPMPNTVYIVRVQTHFQQIQSYTKIQFSNFKAFFNYFQNLGEFHRHT